MGRSAANLGSCYGSGRKRATGRPVPSDRTAPGRTAAGAGQRRITVPLFMDVHSLGNGVTMDDVAKAHQADLAHQDAHQVNYLRYWVDEGQGQIFCRGEAPDAEAAAAVHREAHGLVADRIFPVQEGS